MSASISYESWKISGVLAADLESASYRIVTIKVNKNIRTAAIVKIGRGPWI